MDRYLNDDDFFCDGNVIPWSRCEVLQKAETLDTAGLFEARTDEYENPSELHPIQLNKTTRGRSIKRDLEPVIKCCASEQQAEETFPFLKLPFEIRLQIYQWVYLTHPIKQAQPTPWFPTPTYNNYFLKIVQPYLRLTTKECDEMSPTPSATTAISCEIRKGEVDAFLLSPHRPMAGIPSTLLRANRQIYYEIRDMPLVRNEFVFVNWFASGLWAARSFMKGLKAWQQEKMRYVRLELLSKDLAGTYVEEWQELCRLWSGGLRGLRLKIMSGGCNFGSPVHASSKPGAHTVEVRDGDGKLMHWVEHGLGSLNQLEKLEVELHMADWDNERKVGWCNVLSSALNDMRGGDQQIKVVCVEKSA